MTRGRRRCGSGGEGIRNDAQHEVGAGGLLEAVIHPVPAQCLIWEK